MASNDPRENPEAVPLSRYLLNAVPMSSFHHLLMDTLATPPRQRPPSYGILDFLPEAVYCTGVVMACEYVKDPANRVQGAVGAALAATGLVAKMLHSATRQVETNMKQYHSQSQRRVSRDHERDH